MRAGQLYQFVDTTVETCQGPQSLTLLLYFHAATQQGWIFVESKNMLAEGRELAMAA